MDSTGICFLSLAHASSPPSGDTDVSLGISLRVKCISASGCWQHPLAPVQSQEDNPISPVLCGCSTSTCSPTLQLSNHPTVTPPKPSHLCIPPPQSPFLSTLPLPSVPSSDSAFPMLHHILSSQSPACRHRSSLPLGLLWPWLSHSILFLSPTLLRVPRVPPPGAALLTCLFLYQLLVPHCLPA